MHAACFAIANLRLVREACPCVSGNLTGSSAAETLELVRSGDEVVDHRRAGWVACGFG